MVLDLVKDHSVDLGTAAKMTKRYREEVGSGDVIASAFNQKAIDAIMTQDGCVGMRMYYALKEDGQITLVLVGVNEKGEDLYEGKLMEWGTDCPPDCGGANPLNGMS